MWLVVRHTWYVTAGSSLPPCLAPACVRLVQAGSALIPYCTAGYTELPNSHNSCLFSSLCNYSHQPIVLVPFPQLSTCSAPAWALCITVSGITTTAPPVISPDLAVVPPLSLFLLCWLVWDPHCSSIHTLGHICTLRFLMQRFSSYLKWDSPFLTVTFRIKGVFEARKNLRRPREEKLCTANRYNSTGHRKRQWHKPPVFQMGGYVLAPLLLCSTSQFWKNGATSLTPFWEGKFSEFGFVHLSCLWT